MGAEIRVRRVYDAPSPEDGARVLVDRVWPRGLRKDAARLDEWAKDVAPSAELRTWYRHDPAKFDEFRQRYTAELAQPGPREAIGRLRALAGDQPVTLLTATRELNLSQAAVLAGLLRGRVTQVRRTTGFRPPLAARRRGPRGLSGGRRTSWAPRTDPAVLP
jgi:uncharacterized protein YeaO (DUF488 family)